MAELLVWGEAVVRSSRATWTSRKVNTVLDGGPPGERCDPRMGVEVRALCFPLAFVAQLDGAALS